MLSRFHLIPERYGQTDGRTDRIAINIARQLINWRAIKIQNGYENIRRCLRLQRAASSNKCSCSSVICLTNTFTKKQREAICDAFRPPTTPWVLIQHSYHTHLRTRPTTLYTFGACSTAHRSNRSDHWDGLMLDRSAVGQLSSLFSRTKWQRLLAGDTLRNVNK